ncbi:Respiratory supercomplex factor 1, mitochondrial [Puccinia graminis f. sp. tritici]|uniref:Respiratory supercomplex factor 1, mitochondrial n=1 Tax=Puccinia graminis f. sp. tritici TaxID=56615 RepID=A0A5B0P1B9_PUCGR|nr:Respiratory supercomplex factor 1, mitochondrial [Puccinia graminis f. sp. tritici]
MLNLQSSSNNQAQPQDGSGQSKHQSLIQFEQAHDFDDDDDDQAEPTTWELFSRKFKVESLSIRGRFIYLILAPSYSSPSSLGTTTGPSWSVVLHPFLIL